jgi:c-di-GMP-binding flagellar brake protein YcgR
MSLPLPKYLFLIIALNAMAIAAVEPDSINRFDEFSMSIRHSVDKNFSIQAIVIMLVVVIVLVIFVVLYEARRSNKSRQELVDLAWRRFEHLANTLSLSNNNIAILKEILNEADLQDPSSIIKSPNVFEKSLEKFYKNKKIESIKDEMLTSIRNLRLALGFLPLSREIAFISTRQFDKGEKCLIQVPESGFTIKGMGSVLATEEKHWILARPEGPQIQEGIWARINLTRPGDAEYSFRVQILRDLNGELVLSHTDKLSRVQLRNWVRVDVSIPVEVTQIIDNHVGDVFSGEIIDMSGGGFGIAIPAKLTTGAMLKLSFELPEQGPISGLFVKVVRVAGQHNNEPSQTIHSVAFEGDVNHIQEQIIQYVFEKQRQDSLARLTNDT